MIIVSLLPELLNVNGDAENTRVLVERAKWAGLKPEVVYANHAKDIPENPDLVVIGSGVDSDLDEARKVLIERVEDIRSWVTRKTALLAVGTGWELLSWGIERRDAPPIEGLGVFAGRAVPAESRRVGDIIVDSKLGMLVGFENHARDYIGAERNPLGRVTYGWGNGGAAANCGEGIRMGTAIATHMHGPVCAKNPTVADRLLTDAARHAGVKYHVPDRARIVDEIAKAARDFSVQLALGS